MPRKAKSGTKPQPNGPVEGQRYGESKAQHDLVKSMPAIEPKPTPEQASRRRAALASGTSAGQEAVDLAAFYKKNIGDDVLRGAAQAPDINAVAAQMRGQVGLFNETSRPNEPVTAGLPIGPGPGPEAMQMRRGSPIARTLEQLARDTGDSYLMELAARSQF